jgi:hypothetical protein
MHILMQKDTVRKISPKTDSTRQKALSKGGIRGALCLASSLF